MDSKFLPGRLKKFSYYYAILQLCHLTLLTRAAIIYLSGGQIPFPAQPPVSGWAIETIPFLVGMGAVDALAAGLAIYGGWSLISQGVFLDKLWVISLNIALVSAIVFCFGTIPSGAWGTNAIGYGILAISFTPLFVYYVCLMRFWTQPGLD
jgi:hypothetical protein